MWPANVKKMKKTHEAPYTRVTPDSSQVCQYRCIVSHESPLLEAFSLCILQLHNCRGLNAQPPAMPGELPPAVAAARCAVFGPSSYMSACRTCIVRARVVGVVLCASAADPAPMTSFRGAALTHEAAEDMFIGAVKDITRHMRISDNSFVELAEECPKAAPASPGGDAGGSLRTQRCLGARRDRGALLVCLPTRTPGWLDARSQGAPEGALLDGRPGKAFSWLVAAGDDALCGLRLCCLWLRSRKTSRCRAQLTRVGRKSMWQGHIDVYTEYDRSISSILI